jgi:hypothetical protein
MIYLIIVYKHAQEIIKIIEIHLIVIANKDILIANSNNKIVKVKKKKKKKKKNYEKIIFFILNLKIYLYLFI